MAKLCLVMLLLSGFAFHGKAQEYKWQLLSTEPYPGKQDDIYFIDEQKGWYVNGQGKIYHTADGGSSWIKQLDKPGTFFRTIAFLDDKTGFAGTVGTDYFPNVQDTIPLYKTTDGGMTWNPVLYKGNYVKGLCAIDMVREQYINHGVLAYKDHIFAVGRVGGPANLMVSHDGGENWESRNLDAECKMLFDIKMFNKLEGLICAASDGDVSQSNAMILKTNDGGKTWMEIPLVKDQAARQFGIGFIDEKHGYVGTMSQGYETRDGGLSWEKVDLGRACNKIRILKGVTGNIYGYAIGVNVYKLTIN